MTLDQAREIVSEAVANHGPNDAGFILIERCRVDRDFCHILARHGAEIFAAVIESIGATRH